MTRYQSQEFYASLFYLLLGRELSGEDYSAHFATLDIRTYISSLLDSPEFLEKNIYPALNQASIPIADHLSLIRYNSANGIDSSSFPVVALSCDGLQPLDLCHSARVYQHYFPIRNTQAIHASSQESAHQGIEPKLLHQALQASRGPVELCNTRDALATLLRRAPGLLSSELQQNARLGLELFLLPVSYTFRRYSLYSSLFTSLLGRPLTHDDYDLHFSRLSGLEFTTLLLRSPEFLAKAIFEIIPSCSCARIHSPQQLISQLPGALDDGAYILLSIQSSERLLLAIRLSPASKIVETASEPENLTPADPSFLSDAIIAALIQYNSFTNEDLLSVVDNFSISADVDVATLASLQAGYQLPELTGIFSSASSCTVSLIAAGQLAGLASEHNSESSLSSLIIAI